jgi:Rieske Fe-S protein
MLTAGIAGYALQSCANPARTGLSGTTITLDTGVPANAALAQAGGAVYVDDPNDPERKMIVYRNSDTEVTAFSSRCTHADCIVSLPSGGTAVCRCHNSVFDADGNRLSGPASSDLKKYNSTLSGNVITIEA